MYSELVSVLSGVSSSLPTAMMAAEAQTATSVTSSATRRHIARDAQHQVRVDPGHRVVGHDAETASADVRGVPPGTA